MLRLAFPAAVAQLFAGRHSRITMSLAIALTNSQGKQAGFVLVAGVDEVCRRGSGRWKGRCIFVTLPTEPTLLPRRYREDWFYLKLGYDSSRATQAAILAFAWCLSCVASQNLRKNHQILRATQHFPPRLSPSASD